MGGDEHGTAEGIMLVILTFSLSFFFFFFLSFFFFFCWCSVCFGFAMYGWTSYPQFKGAWSIYFCMIRALGLFGTRQLVS